MSDSELPLISESDCSPVPVFNCIVILGAQDSQGKRTARVANLKGLEVTGTSERDLLHAITRKFKSLVQQHSEQQTTIPWIDPPEQPRDGESRRFIPVHL